MLNHLTFYDQKIIDPVKRIFTIIETLKILEKKSPKVIREKNYPYLWIKCGLTDYFIQFAFKNGFKPIYSTTKRVFEEKKLSNEKIKREYLFEHVCFMPYRRF